ncbi:MAG: replication-associated recombination protein A [Candidatus Omnitrophica bacterium]|nr:replication-associated recombination protein A [Candidatus Omnitrophota bacterium]
MDDLFQESSASSKSNLRQGNRSAPLAFRMRPRTLDEFIGQKHLLGDGKLLRRIVLSDRFSSLIFYGPAGCGKTTLAAIISDLTNATFKSINAVTSNLQDSRRILDAARSQGVDKKRTILFIDEIHRFNKAQQDALMPDVESGNIILIGSTTHNPSFSVNGPLLSRSHIFEFQPLSKEEIIEILRQTLSDSERGYGNLKINVTDEALAHLAKSASGDARRALNALEIGILTTNPDPDGFIAFGKQVAEESCQKKIVYYDHDEDYHYDTASAFIKSMRGSDPDAAVYWLAKMLCAGEDPRFVARRIVILAAEDVGNADPQALILASAGLEAIEFVGMPEARIILSQLVVYMALAPKSNASYMAIEGATKDVMEDVVDEVPVHLRDASYATAKRLKHGTAYQYPHHFQDAIVKQDYRSQKREYYQPNDSGFEKTLKERLRFIKQRKASE